MTTVYAMHNIKSTPIESAYSPYLAVIRCWADYVGDNESDIMKLAEKYNHLVGWGRYSVFCGDEKMQENPCFAASIV